MPDLPSLRGLVAFRAVMETGSFVKAAELLNITPSAVSHQIRTLEQSLKKPLFTRRNRTVHPTETARAFHAGIMDGFARIEAATRQVVTSRSEVRFMIHSVPSFATTFLMPRLRAFIRRFPELDVTLSSGTGPVRLGPDEFRIDIRDILHMGPTPENCEGVDLAREFFVPLASPEFCAEHALVAPSNLARVPLIHSLRSAVHWEQWIARYAEGTSYSTRGMQFDRSFLALAAAADGLGLALESTLLGADLIESGRLIMPFGPRGLTTVAHRLIYRREDRDDPHIRAFVEWILDELAACRDYPTIV
jgi:LysR family glycine cleavage system transcriptional activator